MAKIQYFFWGLYLIVWGYDIIRSRKYRMTVARLETECDYLRREVEELKQDIRKRA